MIRAREIYLSFGYIEWRNFERLIWRASNLINNGQASGTIKKCSTTVNIGSGAKRAIVDYELSKSALKVITNLASAYKLLSFYPSRNETVIISLLAKFGNARQFDFEFQYRLEGRIYDGRIGNVLIEFDEPHHETKVQKRRDADKNQIARRNGFKMLRFDLSHDIIDVILSLDQFQDQLTNKKLEDAP